MPTRERTPTMINGDELGTVVVEADTAEMAMERLADELGDDVRIIDARKVRRGGVGGFFSRELVQLTAQIEGAAQVSFAERLAAHAVVSAGRDAARPVATQEATSLVESADRANPRNADSVVISSMARATEPQTLTADDITFAPQPRHRGPIAIDLREAAGSVDSAEAIDAELVDEPVRHVTPTTAHPALVETEVMDPDPERQSTAELVFTRAAGTPPSPTLGADMRHRSSLTARMAHDDGTGAVAWGATSLVRLGLPAPLIAALDGVDPADDAACLMAVAGAVAPLCGPAPTEDVAVVGPTAWQVAMLMDVPMCSIGDTPDAAFALDSSGAAADRGWLDAIAADRDIHLVVSTEPGWRDLLFRAPEFVSWTDHASVVDALYVASTLGATLAYGTDDNGQMVVARPLDVAIAVRDLVGRRW